MVLFCLVQLMTKRSDQICIDLSQNVLITHQQTGQHNNDIPKQQGKKNHFQLHYRIEKGRNNVRIVAKMLQENHKKDSSNKNSP